MNLAESITIFISGIFPFSMTNSLMLISPFGKPVINIVFVSIYNSISYYNSFGPYCSDMETASLFLKGKEFGVQVAAVLQNVIKQKKEAPYKGSSGEQAIKVEREIVEFIVSSMNP